MVLLSAGSQILLIKRRKWPFQDMWALPGGKLNPGESLEEAAARELCEETGVQGSRSGSSTRTAIRSVIHAATL